MSDLEPRLVDLPWRLGEMKYPGSVWVRGSLRLTRAMPTVGIVGARSPSGYGRRVARTLARELAEQGVVVVSGLARGVDAEAHLGALEAAGGRTVAVLGCGIDRAYPAAHADLYARICESGLIVSEYEAGVEPAPWRFPARNRLIALLSDALVVVEARERSGALITADLMLESRHGTLFAVPGEITSLLSAGTNRLLAEGLATALVDSAQVLEVLDEPSHARRGRQAATVRDEAVSNPTFGI